MIICQMSTINCRLYKVREPDEGEEDSTDEEEGTEKAEIAQGGSTEGNQSEESAYGGDISNYKGFHDFIQGLTHIACMVEMGDEVQGIVDGDSHDDR